MQITQYHLCLHQDRKQRRTDAVRLSITDFSRRESPKSIFTNVQATVYFFTQAIHICSHSQRYM